MLIKQISIFIENKMGRLSEIINVLSENNIDIRALSIADTTNYGILRLIVNDPDKAYKAVKETGATVHITEVIAVGVDDKPGGLAKAISVLKDEDIPVEYMYAFISKADNKANVILRVDDNEKAVMVLKRNNIPLLSPEEVH